MSEDEGYVLQVLGQDGATLRFVQHFTSKVAAVNELARRMTLPENAVARYRVVAVTPTRTIASTGWGSESGRVLIIRPGESGLGPNDLQQEHQHGSTHEQAEPQAKQDGAR